MSYTFSASNLRVAKAKLATLLGGFVQRILQMATGLLLFGAIALILAGQHWGFCLAGLSLMLITFLIWIRHDLQVLPAAQLGTTTQLELLLPATLAAHWHPNPTASQLWQILGATPEAIFLVTRFGLQADTIPAALEGWALDHDQLWTTVETLSQATNQPTLATATIICALFELNPRLTAALTAAKLSPEDLTEGAHWLHRLAIYSDGIRPFYGGLGRDWASGFTPMLSRYGTNLSQQIEFAGNHPETQERTNQLDALVTALDSANGSVVLIGEPGIGKSAILLGLADRLLRDQAAGSLAHHQIVTLNASIIISQAESVGSVETVVLNLISEAEAAGNIIIALDEAQLFFGQGTGAVNLSQLLLPVLQARHLKLVLALSPGDWQKLRATNTAMASLLTPLVLAEPDQAQVMRLLADRALSLEQGRFITTWSALLEAYRLSGRYFQDEAYPGKALKTLEAAFNYPVASFITSQSVDQAIESQFGVKVQTASASESDVLLHLEDKIHQRMINQTRAVSVVANALRRARAGVSNPRRPIGSFLFLGPTGVGKTELAKSLAALYFGSEQAVIRLDMSEYQQVADVDRILEGAATNPSGLLARVRQTPFSVVLFDEIEKAHPNILNIFLQLLDEGNLTDITGHPASFKDAIVIATSNAGADEIRAHIAAGESLESFEEQFTNDLIDAGLFKPELINRFDEVVLFRPLNEAELNQVVRLMIGEVNKTLSNQKVSVVLTDDAIAQLVTAGYDPRLGARPMRRMVQRRVEDAVANQILQGLAQPGTVIELDAAHLAGTAPANEAPNEPPAT